MARDGAVEVTGRDGLRGSWCRPEGEGTPTPGEWVEIRLDDGRLLTLPGRLLERLEDGTFAIPIGSGDIPPPQERIDPVANGDASERIIPVVAERVEVGKRTVKAGKIRVHKTVEVGEEVVDMPLARDELDVERVPIDRIVEGPVAIRREGDTIVVPILEEELVVQVRVRLREEIRITRKTVESRDLRTIRVRKEVATVERVPSGSGEPIKNS